MNIPRIRLAAIGIVALAIAARAGTPDMAVWTHAAPVQLKEAPARGLVEFALTPEVFALARADLADLRLMNHSGNVVPYVLRVDRGETGEPGAYAPVRMFNAVHVPGRQSTVSVDFGTRAKRTRIDIDTPGTNFRRRVRIEASQDDETWQVLKASDWLFRIRHEQGSYEKSQVILPDNDFRFLRVTVFLASDDPPQVDILGVMASHSQGTLAQCADAPARITVSENTKIRATEIIADLDYENLPLYDLTLAFDDPNFVRRVEILGRNAPTRTVVEPVENSQPRTRQIEAPWVHLAGGIAYRLPAGEGQDASEGLSLQMAGQCRYLLVRIYNGDDAPLKFTHLNVRRLQTYVAFRHDTTSTGTPSHQLFFGNPDAAPPQYDLIQYANRLRSEGVTTAMLGTAAPNPLYAVPTKTLPWTERHAVLLWTVLAAVLAVLATLVLRQTRQARSMDGQDP